MRHYIYTLSYTLRLRKAFTGNFSVLLEGHIDMVNLQNSKWRLKHLISPFLEPITPPFELQMIEKNVF